MPKLTILMLRVLFSNIKFGSKLALHTVKFCSMYQFGQNSSKELQQDNHKIMVVLGGGRCSTYCSKTYHIFLNPH